MGSIECELTDDRGRPIADSQGRSYLKEFLSLTATRALNQIGNLSLYVPASFDQALLRPDRMIQLWRRPTGGRRGLWRVFFIRAWEFADVDGKKSVLIEGPDQNELLRRRIVAAYTGSDPARKTGLEADDMMKEVVSEALLDTAEPVPTAGTRAWSSFSVQSDLTLGPVISRSFPFEKLLTTSGSGVLPEIAKAAKEAGTEVWFDVVPVLGASSISFQFQTFTRQPGMDVTDRVVFSEETSNLKNARLRYDYTEEENYIYSGGKGEGSARNVQQVYDTTRYSQSQWGRIEGFINASGQADDNDEVEAIGNTRLWEGRPRIRFSGDFIDTQAARFGLDWDLGYKVKTRYRNIEFDSIVRAVSITATPRSEEVKVRVDYES